MPLLPTNLSAGNTGHIGHSNQAYSKLNDLPNLKRDFGGVGDGSTNDTTAVANFLTELGSQANANYGHGGTGVVPKGIYPTDQFTVSRGVHVIGLGNPREDARFGAHFMARANNQIILYKEASGGVAQEGFRFSNMGFYCGSFTGVTGAKILGVNRWHFDNCMFHGLDATALATGIYCSDLLSDGTTYYDCAWWHVDKCEFRRCQTGASIAGTGGRIRDCNFVPPNSFSNEVGVRLRSVVSPAENSQSTLIEGCMFDSSSSGVAVLAQSDACRIVHNKFEGSGGTDCAVKIEQQHSGSGKRNLVMSNSFTGYEGVGGTGVRVGSGCEDNGIFFNMFITVNTPNIVDSGTATKDFHNRKSNGTWT